MTDNKIPEIDRRQKETGMIGHIVETLIGKQSRKVAFGVWGFIADNAFLASGKITPDLWWKVFLTCALLIGFGTILDEVILTFGKSVAVWAATKVQTIVNTKVETTVTDAVPPPPETGQ